MKIDNENEIVISGVGCCLPKSRNIEDFKQCLLSNESLMQSRWKENQNDVTNLIGAMPDVQLFDASYFGVHREQSTFMDPMQRSVLERTLEALIDAGVNPLDIRGKKIAVYAGSSVGENDNLFYEAVVSGFGVTGHSRSMMPNRISYWLNLKGPSCAYDCNWLNGFHVIQAGYDVIKSGECDSAIVLTANLVLNSELSWLYNDMGLLSPDGCTRAFDANANGYSRSDGIVVMYLQRACDAKRSYATILGVDLKFNGNRDGPLREIDTNAMTKFIDTFYENTDVKPQDVEYVECYGSGDKTLDKAELAALDAVYCKNRTNPLLIGSVKSNSGHAEASAAMVSLVKVLIAMESGVLPANINYETPNPNIPSLVEGRIEVVNKNREWNAQLAAIHGIGVASSYGHLLLKANPKIKKPLPDELPRLVAISTRTDQGIQDILTSLKSEPKIDPEYVGLIQTIFKKAIPGHLYRGYAVLDGSEEVKSEFEYFPGNKRQIWFVYSGMGSQWCKMGKDLLALPIFAAAIKKCHAVLEPKGIDLLKIITEDDAKMFENILHSFVGIAAIQIGLTDVLLSLDIVPDGIIGHSVGELGCAYADGCLSAEQMILCAYSRGRASLEAELIQGMMAAIGKGYQQIKNQVPPSIEVACHNGPDSSTISGPTKDMEDFVKKLQDEGTFARLVNVSNIAYHSKYIKPAAPLLLNYLKEVIPEPLPRSKKWISTSVAEEQWDTDLAKTSSAEYHTNNLLSSVLFEEGSRHIPKESVVIEIAPHGLLQAILKRSLKSNCTNVPLTHRTSPNGLNFLLGAIGKLYLAGLDLNIPALYPPIQYPVSKGTKSLAPLVHWEHSEQWQCGIEDKQNYMASVKNLNFSLQNEEHKEMVGNQVKNSVIVPMSAYIAVLYELLNGVKVSTLTEFIIENFMFKNILAIPKSGTVPLHIMMQKGNGRFEITSAGQLIAYGIIRSPETEKFFSDAPKLEATDNSLKLTEDDVYSEFYHRGHKYDGTYKFIKSLELTKDGSISKIKSTNNWCHLIDGMIQQWLFHKGENYQNTLTISSIQRISVNLTLLPTEPTEIEVTYEYDTKLISTEGIQMSIVDVKPLTLPNFPISYDSIEFTPLSNRVYESIESGINLGLHIVLENMKEKKANSVMIVEIQSENESLDVNIKNVVNKYSTLSTNMSTVKDPKMILISQVEPLYVISNNTITYDCVKLLTSSHAFLLVQTDKNIMTYSQISQVAQFSVNGVSYSLLRKCSKINPVIIKIKSDTMSANDLSHDNLPWVSQLKSAVASEKENKVYLVASIVPFEGIPNFVQDVRNLPNMENVRFAFILDKKAPEFSVSEPVYQRIFNNDLTIVVVKDGYLGSYSPTPIEFKTDIPTTGQTTSNIVDNTRIDYLGVNLRDDTILTNKAERQVELGNIDYSGVTSTGEKIMGLAHLDKEFCKLVPDSVLFWSVPERWSLEDAVTIPNAYSMAYYALVVTARTQPKHTVLVHGGCSAVGLAAISIATSIGCTVFTTVTSNEQRQFMKKRVYIPDRKIFNALNTSFEPYLLMATGGEGAHVILNCVSGSMLNATMRCVAEFGRVVQMGKYDLEQNREIGMRVFLKNVSFISATPDDLHNSSIEVKQRIQSLVQEGIGNIVVRPLQRKLAENQDVKSILNALKQPENIGKIILKLSDNLVLSELNISNTSQFICDQKSAYLIYGGTPKMWTDIVEWLTFRGARKIVVSCDSKLPTTINRRLALLRSYFNSNIVFVPTKAHNRESTSELLSSVYNLGPIGAVFVMSGQDPTTKISEIKAVQYLDCALKTTAPKALLINFSANAAGVCHLRADAGFPTHNIQWDTTMEFSDFLYALDHILRFKIKDIFIKNDQSKDTINETAQSLYEKLSLLLPNTIEQIKDEIKIASKQPDFFQVPSLCAPVVREVPPVFVIPGMFGRRAVKDLAKQLLHPVHCANYPTHSISLEKYTTDLAKRIKEIYPKGPYNIIGISYGSILAIKVAKLLEEREEKIQLFIIDGAPQTIQGVLKHLGEGANNEIGFLCRILNLTNPDIVKDLSNLSEWETRLKFALKHCKWSEEDKLFLREVLTTFKMYLDAIYGFQPSGDLIVGANSLIRPSGGNQYDYCGLLKYCKQCPEIIVINGDHNSILNEKLTAKFINNKVIMR